MDKYFLLKCLISFFIGAIVYKLLSDRCSCNLLEGQEADTTSPPTTTPPPTATPPPTGATPTTTPPTGATPTGTTATDPSTDMNTIGMIDMNTNIGTITNLINEINGSIFNNLNSTNNFNSHITYIYTAISSIDSDIPEPPENINDVMNFYELGSNPNALDYVEILVRSVSNMSDGEFITLMNNMTFNDEYCNNDTADINAYIMALILLQYYNTNKNNKQEYIIISNRLSKYVPDILEKVQSFNETYCGEDSDKHIKSQILSSIMYKLFKKNQTIITFGSIKGLINDLSKMDKVYGVVMLLCLTYIIVKFMGMFNMKIDV